ncbi:MAG: FHA domain-containing protein [Anaerolineae bacterium]|nr:FHA domain-containing protein [Anaerolineae bacterium]MCI0609770.1 FHA domain-containing protein [Anaerolineae bacterium]
MKLRLDQLEANLQKLVEDQLAGILPGLKLEDRVIQHLATALRENVIQQKDESAIAPDTFTLIVATDTSPMWKEERIIDALKNIITTAGKDVGLKFTTQPTINITTDDTFSADEVRVVATHKLEPVAETQGMQTSLYNEEPGEGENIPENAFLIIEGVKVHQLSDSVVNIGRRLENQLVIDDPRVSRNHAQLRAIKGRFVLFDLNSTGGTFVNGQRTSQTVLYPGDVISLAGVALIFGQDNPPPRLDSDALSGETEPGASERPTATVDQNTVDIKTDSLKFRFREEKPPK